MNTLFINFTFNNSRRTLSLFSRPTYNFLLKRFMMASRCIYATRAAYHAALVLANPDTLDNISPNNTKPLIRTIVHYSLNDTQGIVQHKTAILKHLSNQQYPGSHFYDPFYEYTSFKNITHENNALIDFRTNNELASLNEYTSMFGRDILNIYATLDKPSPIIIKTSQANVDFVVKLDYAMGLRRALTYQDDKSGMDMFKHSTKGSIGVIYYDQNGTNIQMTAQPINISDLLEYNLRRIRMIDQTVKNDDFNSQDDIFKAIEKAMDIQTKMKGTSYTEFTCLHNELQNLLWKEIQCHPQFQQSLSFVFLKQIINQPITEKQHMFSKSFQANLQDNKLYNLNKKGDVNEFYNAFIRAGKEIDPQFIKKLHYLHNNGLTLNYDILHILNKLVKDGLY